MTEILQCCCCRCRRRRPTLCSSIKLRWTFPRRFCCRNITEESNKPKRGFVELLQSTRLKPMDSTKLYRMLSNLAVSISLCQPALLLNVRFKNKSTNWANIAIFVSCRRSIFECESIECKYRFDNLAHSIRCLHLMPFHSKFNIITFACGFLRRFSSI